MRADGHKADVKPHPLLVERKKFASYGMVSAGVYVGRKGHLHFADEKEKVSAVCYTWKNCCQNWLKIVNICYEMVSSSSKTALRVTRHASHRTG